jgi:membrane-associated phospholipid phosphatase
LRTETTDLLQIVLLSCHDMKSISILIFVLLISYPTFSQQIPDSARFVEHTSINRIYSEDPSLLQTPHFKEWIVPTTLILYGVLSVHVDALTDVNEQVHNLIWVKHPHNTVSIDNYLQFAPAVAVYGLNLAGIHGANNYLDLSMIYLLSNIILNTAVSTIKNISHVQRPNGADYLSFPSGHTTEAFASAEFLMQEYKNVSIWYGISGYLVAGSVAYLRMYNNKHWFGDVVAGAGFGIMSTRLAYTLYPKIKKIFSHTPIPNSVMMPSYQNHCFGISFVHEFKY